MFNRIKYPDEIKCIKEQVRVLIEQQETQNIRILLTNRQWMRVATKGKSSESPVLFGATYCLNIQKKEPINIATATQPATKPTTPIKLSVGVTGFCDIKGVSFLKQLKIKSHPHKITQYYPSRLGRNRVL